MEFEQWWKERIEDKQYIGDQEAVHSLCRMAYQRGQQAQREGLTDRLYAIEMELRDNAKLTHDTVADYLNHLADRIAAIRRDGA